MSGLGLSERPLCPTCGEPMRKNTMALLLSLPVVWVCDRCREERS